MVDGDRRLTYAEFNAYVNRLAHGKIQKNVVRSEHAKYYQEG